VIRSMRPLDGSPSVGGYRWGGLPAKAYAHLGRSDVLLAFTFESSPGKLVDRPMNTSHLLLWTDGSSRLHTTGLGGIGVVGKYGDETVFKVCENIGPATNNVAEYTAVTRGLERALDIGAERVTLRIDSRVVYRHYLGTSKCRAAHLIPLLDCMRQLMSNFDVGIERIPTKENREADRLAKAGSLKVPKQQEGP